MVALAGWPSFRKACSQASVSTTSAVLGRPMITTRTHLSSAISCVTSPVSGSSAQV